MHAYQQPLRAHAALSPLDSLAKQTRSRVPPTHQSSYGTAHDASTSHHPVGGSSLRGRGDSSAHRPQPLELSRTAPDAGAKGKARAVMDDGWDGYGHSEVLVRGHEGGGGPLKLSPLRQHRFQSSVSTMRTDRTEAPSEYSDAEAEADSPTVPEHTIPSRSSPPRPAYHSSIPVSSSSSSLPDAAARSGSALSNASSSRSQTSAASGATFGVPHGRSMGGSLGKQSSIRRQESPFPYEQQPGEGDLESLQGDRSTWHSEWEKDRASVATSLGLSQGGIVGKMPRESVMSSRTVDSTTDPFHFSVYESLPSPSANFQPDPFVELPTVPSTSPATIAAPAVVVGPPSPVSSQFLPSDKAVAQPLSRSSSSGSARDQAFLGASSSRSPDTSPSPAASATPSTGGRDSPTQFSHYASALHDVDPNFASSPPRPAPSPPTQLPSPVSPAPAITYSPRESDEPSYRIDSYYGASPSQPDIPSSFSLDELEAQRARNADSPRQRNVLRKSRPAEQPSPEIQPSPSKWSMFRPRSKSHSRVSKDTIDTAGYPRSPDPPTIAFSEEPSTSLGVNPDDILRRISDVELKRKTSAPTTLRPSPGKSGFVHSGGGLSPSFQSSTALYSEEMERLDEGPTQMARSASDIGPLRTQDHQRASSSNSLYSNYSFYSMPPEDITKSRSPSISSQTSPATSPAPSPMISPAVKFDTSATGPGLKPSNSIAKAKAGIRTAPVLVRSPSGTLEPKSPPKTADDFLQLGIDYHEEGELERAAWYFERSAKVGGGCGAGMLLYGLTLRHGWGCQVNAALGFKYLQRAAETVINDLDRVVGGGRKMSQDEMGAKAVKNELVLALYELGTSFRFGWGVQKDKKMAVSYFLLAADLGDPDAQSDLAFAYANGKGCKKDLKKAAKYYRLAVAQGVPSFGLSWIYKPKYLDDA
ncbi:cell cycle inhibitor, Nif1 [Pseudohyphozyma bogoriensis]|nr:cell cycle inhibitor, Nif1 [Pseudohyphozyma bogoriensis]